MSASLRAIGTQLQRAGMTARGLAGWAGTDRVSMLPLLFERISRRPRSPAGALLELFVAGLEVDAAAVAKLGVVVEPLVAHGLVQRSGGALRAPIAIVPLGPSLLVCDRDDAPVELYQVPFPDDSSHHLAGAIPERAPRWLDLACGSAFSPLARPQVAAQIRCTDLNPRAIRYAQLGAALSGVAHLTAGVADIGATQPPAELVTCNAPLPEPDDPVLWRGTDTGFFARLWAAAEACAHGLVVVHAVEDALTTFAARAPGERVVAIYTPPTELGFGVLWWRPAAPSRRIVERIELTPARPHVDARAYEQLRM